MRRQRHKDHPTLYALSAPKNHYTPATETRHGTIVNCTNGTDEIICPKPVPFVECSSAGLTHDEYESIKKSYDGVTLRFFHFGGVWNVATSTRVDARDAYWGSPRSFFALMLDALVPNEQSEAAMQTKLDVLDKSNVYTVLLLHPEHICIIMNPRPALLLLDVYDRRTSSFVPYAVPSIFEQELGSEFQPRGVQWDLPDGTRCRDDAAWFVRAQELRMNRKDITEAYIHQWPECSHEFHMLFPWAHGIFTWWCAAIPAFEEWVYQVYVRRYIYPNGTAETMQELLIDPILEAVHAERPREELARATVMAVIRSWHTVDFMDILRRSATAG